MADPKALSNKFKNVKYKNDAIRGRLRESLAEGIYPDVDSSFHVLRELVQNGADSIKDFREEEDPYFEGEIRIRISSDSISVYDTGSGMGLDKLREVPAFAASDKDPALRIGFRGIGFWATSALATEVIIISKRLGDKHKNALRIDIASWKKDENQLSVLELLNKYVYEDEPSTDDTDAHYTMIILGGLTEAGKHLVTHISDARKYLRTTLPLEFETSKEFQRRERIRELILENVPDKERSTFRVFLNEDELFKPGYHALQEILFDEITKLIPGRKPRTEIIGWYWAALHKEPEKIKDPLVKGIRFRVKGIAIGDENLLRNLLKTDKETPDWYYGEIYVLDPDIKPDSSRTHFEGNQAWQDFIDALTGSGGITNKLKNRRRKFSDAERARIRIPELIAEVDVVTRRTGPLNTEQIQEFKKELQKRSKDATNPELKINAQQATKKLDKALSSRSSKSSKAKGKPRPQSALDRFYLKVRTILATNVSNEALREKITKMVDKAFRETQQSK
jgi:hypothetical protein